MSRKTKMSGEIRAMVLCAMFVAIIVVMTVIPYTGYINYSPLQISITTLHIPVILCACLMGWKYGAVVGGVWGLSCVVKAFVEPLPANIPFQNPVISFLPRVIVGIAAALLFSLLTRRTRLNRYVCAGIAALAGTLTNTVLVLSAYSAFGYLGESSVAATLKFIFLTLIAVNGLIELGAAVLIVPALLAAIDKTRRKYR